MSFPIARLGDTSSHGGQIITSAKFMRVEGKLVARVDDLLACPIHGNSPIVTGSPTRSAEGKKIARTSSVCACGATIVGGAKFTVCS